MKKRVPTLEELQTEYQRILGRLTALESLDDSQFSKLKWLQTKVEGIEDRLKSDCFALSKRLDGVSTNLEGRLENAAKLDYERYIDTMKRLAALEESINTHSKNHGKVLSVGIPGEPKSGLMTGEHTLVRKSLFVIRSKILGTIKDEMPWYNDSLHLTDRLMEIFDEEGK